MKRILLLIIAIAIGTFTANAQIGGLIERGIREAKKNARNTEQQAREQAQQQAEEQATESIKEQLGVDEENVEETSNIDDSEPLTYESLMRQMPELPSVKDMVNHKKAELNGQGIKLLTSSVTKFQLSVLELTSKVYTIQCQDADSAQIMEAAYKNAELYTGLSREEIDMLSEMSEEEQEAYLATHYNEGQAEAELMREAMEASEYLKPLEPKIDQWTEVDNRVNKIYEDADKQCAAIYKKYVSKLDPEDESEYNKNLLKYYEEVAPIIRQSVVDGSKVRLDEQLPIAMEIEEEMIKIRAEHQDVYSALLNYAVLTASQYFTDALKICEIPEYPEDNE